MVNRSTSSGRRVVLLDAFRDHLGIVHGLAAQGCYQPVVVGCSHDNSLRFSRKCEHVTFPDWRWDRGPAQLAAAAGRGAKPVLLPVSMRAVEWTVRHREQLAKNWLLVPLPAAAQLVVAGDKVRLAQLAQNQGLSTPPLVPLDCQSWDQLRELSFPVLLKPRSGFGGSGIVRFETYEALVEHLGGMSAPQNYFVQTFLEGQDISCGVYCRAGEVQSSFTYVPLARETCYGRFTSIQTIENEKVSLVVARLMRALSWEGVANIDLIQSPSGEVFILEVNPRCWGNMSAAIPLGLNFAGMLCQGAMREHVPRQFSRCGRFFDALDTLALLREWLVNRQLRGEISFRQLWRYESSLRLISADPLPALMALASTGAVRGGIEILRRIRQHHAPAVRSTG